MQLPWRMRTKKELAVTLSKLKVFDAADIKLEQYPTDSEIASDVLWSGYMNHDLKGTIADLGAGTGILGIGALLLGSSKVFFVEKDAFALKILHQNVDEFDNYEIISSDISEFDIKVDVVIMNPPFGTRIIHADTDFLLKAFSIAPVIYSFHKTSTKAYIEGFSNKNGYQVTTVMDFTYPLKKTQKQHKRNIHRIDVSCFRLQRVH